ncbi:hypothetical protein BD324DRAFT_649916 [Kockovaella imperatae]|uniref:SUR7/PalI family-domain-containing protein n=1 Tax=Kockovaella imperatae TaxID=4999 RepID=A0A1Y1UKH4_9TREE|nr:hypothetical protein BD324DRAFT_649916 [Kockovaella imperatae]ORX38553.1 hypothetical protein BD324DRAFT_649916 [Kockovaella imperatae]
MGVRFRNATPGTLLMLAVTGLLAVVSFNTPLLKSLYFLHATYSSGEYSGQMYLGTMGYCLDYQGTQTCEGPTIGYEFNPNELFGISLFDIPTTITKYLTYTLVLHLVALAAAAGSFVFGLLSHIGTMGVWCFPTCLASIASSTALIALVFDLVIFYIAKARIDDVNGASANIGICVWLVLAAWLLAGFGGCAFGLGNCCLSRRNNRNSGDPKMDYYSNSFNRSDDMRLQALRDEQLRKKEQGLPSFQELERTPLTGTGGNDAEDKYLYEEQPIPRSRSTGSGLARDGSVLQGVGLGYGRRMPGGAGAAEAYPQGTFGNGYGGYETLQQPPSLARRISNSSGVTAGNAGVGAGGQGVEAPEVPQNQSGGYGGYYGQNHNYYETYNDPYQQRPQQGSYEYGHDGYNPNGQQQQYDQHYGTASNNPHDPNHSSYDRNVQGYEPQYGTAMTGSTMEMPMPSPKHASSNSNTLAAGAAGGGRYVSNPGSSESHYPDVGPSVSHAADPYGGYDDGLGAIGMAATSPSLNNPHQSYDRAGPSRGGSGGAAYDNPQIQVPQPQHLTSSSQSQNNILHSPVSPGPVGPGHYGPNDYRTQDHESDDAGDVDAMGNRPPSYGQIAGAPNTSWNTTSRNEKSGYR